MSRPFSYNDENFTVINNLLFCHILINEDVSSGRNIIEVPSAIANRLLYKSSIMIRASKDFNSLTAANINVGIRNVGGTYYLYGNENIVASKINYIYGFYLLKDI